MTARVPQRADQPAHRRVVQHARRDAGVALARVPATGAAIEAGRKCGAAIPGIPVADTIKQIDTAGTEAETSEFLAALAAIDGAIAR